MINKIDKRNYLKIWIGYIIAAAVVAAGSAVMLYMNFAARVSALQSSQTTMAGMHHHGEDAEDILNGFTFTTTDKIMIGAVIALAAAFAVTYWIFTVESMIKQTRKDGTDTKLFGWLTGIFNVLAVAGYFIYRGTLLKCPECGRYQTRKETLFCRHCGARMQKECPICGAYIKPEDDYCHNCGKKLAIKYNDVPEMQQ